MTRSLAIFLLLTGILASLHGTTTAKKGFGPGEQDWGWYEVRKGAHMFYWLFYTQDPTVNSFYDKPLVIYLFGGPGISSTGYSNFIEVGPLLINGSQRSSSWAKHVNLMFIDNPVGVGYSYVEPGENFTSTNEDIGGEMVEFLTKFYKDHSEFNSVPLYIFGESYGGKMVVEIAKQLYEGIKAQKLKANFKGIGLADPWISPFDTVLSWGPVLLHTGFVDQQGYDRIMAAGEKFKKASDGNTQNDYFTLFEECLFVIKNETGMINFYNYLDPVGPYGPANESTSGKNESRRDSTSSRSGEINQLMNENVKTSLGVPNDRKFENYKAYVRYALKEDFRKPVTTVVEEILNNTDLQVVVYNGQLDLIVTSIGTLRWVDGLNWPGSSMWHSAGREPFVIDGIIEGYVKSAGNLHFYSVYRAGHMIPIDNPKAGVELLKRVTEIGATA